MFQQSLSLPAIVTQLRNLCQEQQTGTLHIIDGGHLLAQISLEKGDITSVVAKKHHGIDALPILLDIQVGDIAFAASRLSTPRMPLPSTPDILAILEGRKPVAASSLPSAQVSPLGLTEAAKAVLEQTLKEFIGPIARMICADHFRAAATFAAAIDALADEVPTPQAAAQFRERVQQRLRG
jgi:hypothetical protein